MPARHRQFTRCGGANESRAYPPYRDVCCMNGVPDLGAVAFGAGRAQRRSNGVARHLNALEPSFFSPTAHPYQSASVGICRGDTVIHRSPPSQDDTPVKLSRLLDNYRRRDSHPTCAGCLYRALLSGELEFAPTPAGF